MNQLLSKTLSGLFVATAITACSSKEAPKEAAPAPETTQQAAPPAPPAAPTGECWGINACKGKGDCGGKGHSCAGKNSCKGKGWLQTTEKECKAKKGKFKKD